MASPQVRELLGGLRAAPQYDGGYERADAEPDGWNHAVAPLLSESAVVRVNDTHLRIAIPQVADLDRTSNNAPS